MTATPLCLLLSRNPAVAELKQREGGYAMVVFSVVVVYGTLHMRYTYVTHLYTRWPFFVSSSSTVHMRHLLVHIRYTT